ncbi:MAG: hypothetical protein CYG60_12580 [Actinobacteria bacterium]|nr:MAG: hypothetical protein CYG60_12580 [Actinomycetota bacterium]
MLSFVSLLRRLLRTRRGSTKTYVRCTKAPGCEIKGFGDARARGFCPRGPEACGVRGEGKGTCVADEVDHYTVDEAAGILGLSPVRVRQMCRSGDLRAERREGRIEGVLGPWRIRKDAVHSYSEGRPAVDHAERRDEKLDDEITVASAPLGGAEAKKARWAASDGEAAVEKLDTETPSEASELLSESVRNLRQRAEALVTELERLEGRLEFAEIQDLALREALQRETENSEGLRAELEAERSRRGDP